MKQLSYTLSRMCVFVASAVSCMYLSRVYVRARACIRVATKTEFGAFGLPRLIIRRLAETQLTAVTSSLLVALRVTRKTNSRVTPTCERVTVERLTRVANEQKGECVEAVSRDGTRENQCCRQSI